MDDTLKQNLFFKVEQKLESTFNSLHKYSLEEKSRALKEVLDSLWMLERISPVMFKKIVKDIDENLIKINQETVSLVNKFETCEVSTQGLVLTYKDHSNKVLPIASITELREKFQSKKYFKGYYIQLAYLLRPQNLLTASLWLHKELV